MPYVNVDDRALVDYSVRTLADKVNGRYIDRPLERAGVLNYCITRLALQLFPQRKYWMLALVVGVFITCALEFYRRRVAPYEDHKSKENGDVYD